MFDHVFKVSNLGFKDVFVTSVVCQCLGFKDAEIVRAVNNVH